MSKKLIVILGIIFTVLILFFIYWFFRHYKLSVLQENMKRIELSEETRIKYISNGEQTLSPEHINIIESEIAYNENVVELLKNIYEWKKSNLDYEHAHGEFVGKRTVRDIFNDEQITGCHDDGIFISSILRHYQIANVMVDTSGINWVSKFNSGKTNSFSGHVFLEIYYEDKCFLFDPTFGKLVIGYDPDNKIIPTTFWFLDSKGFYTMYKGIDPLSYGITSIEVLINKQREFAKEFQGRKFEIPDYNVVSIRQIDFDN